MQRLNRKTTIPALTVLGALTLGYASAQEVIEEGAYIRSAQPNAAGNLCLFVQNTLDRSPVRFRECPDNSGGPLDLKFLWQVRRDGAGGLTISSLASDVRGNDNRRLEVADWSISSSAPIQIWGPNAFDTSNQRWFQVPSREGGFLLVSVKSGLCLNVPLNPSGTPAMDKQMQQFTCGSGTPNERWSFAHQISRR